MSKHHLPPVPPENRPGKGPVEQHPDQLAEGRKPDTRDRDLSKQGRQGNINQNTHHQGYQQDR
jgi:hypothetical protein